MKNMSTRWATLLFTALLLAACAGQKDAATKAVSDIESSLTALGDDAMKYAAEEYQQAQTGLASLKDQLGNKDYKGVVAAAPAVSAQVAALQQTVAAKREEAQAAMAAASEEWKTLSAELPDMVAAIQSRVDMLSQSKKLPKNVSKDSFQAAQDGLAATRTSWTEATAAFGSGDPVKAVELAKAAKESGTAALQALGMGEKEAT